MIIAYCRATNTKLVLRVMVEMSNNKFVVVANKSFLG